jgi:6-phosphogluconolactonase/glucosamine-6-phosphate isomerase/deaminase
METEQECASFESQLMARGGVNLVVATLGEHGALGMNFPGQSLGSRTRMVQLLPDAVPVSLAPNIVFQEP